MTWYDVTYNRQQPARSKKMCLIQNLTTKICCSLFIIRTATNFCCKNHNKTCIAVKWITVNPDWRNLREFGDEPLQGCNLHNVVSYIDCDANLYKF